MRLMTSVKQSISSCVTQGYPKFKAGSVLIGFQTRMRQGAVATGARALRGPGDSINNKAELR